MTPANRQSPRQKRRFLLIVLAILASALIVWAVQSSAPVEYLEPKVLAEYPHDTSAYTQGLLWREGILYESTGKYGSSALRKVDLESGRVLQSHHLGDSYFGEGLERVGDRLIQLTWDEKVAFVHDLDTFQPLDTFSYRGQGWGLCFDGERLFMSNGSDTLLVREPQQFLVVDRKRVTTRFRALMDQHADPGAARDSRIEAAQPFGPRLSSSRENLNLFAENEFWRRTGLGFLITSLGLALALLSLPGLSGLTSGS